MAVQFVVDYTLRDDGDCDELYRSKLKVNNAIYSYIELCVYWC